MFLRPVSIDEAVTLLARDGGVLLSGGTDVFPSYVDRPLPERFIDLSAIEDLRGITRTPEAFRIGGCTTWTEIVRADLPPAFDGLKRAAREVGSVQVQNAGTVAGNLCNASPAADGVPPLLALDAEVELVSSAGTRRLSLDRFITGYRSTDRRPDEILTAILIPRVEEAARSTFLKLGARRYLVISIVMVAVNLRREPGGRIVNARIAVGSASAVAQRLTALEARLESAAAGVRPAVLVSHDDLAPLSPIDDGRATAAYRRDAVMTLIKRALDAVDGGPSDA